MDGTDRPTPGTGQMADRVVALGRDLRARGFAVAPADTADALAAITHLDLARRIEVRESLRATLVKRPDPAADFDALFERWFPARPRDDRSRPGPTDPTELASSLAASLAASGDPADLAELANELVDRYGGLDTDGELRTARHHVQRVLRAADLTRLMMLAMHDHDQSDRASIRARVEMLARLVAIEVSDRLGELAPDAFDLDAVEFLRASNAEIDRMRAVVPALVRRLASRLERRRRHATTGRLDMRRTARRSLATGGVPFEPALRRRRPHRPELFVLCDVSGSVAEFSLFTLSLVAALSEQLPRTRTFVFVDAVDEITSLLHRTDHRIEPWQLLRNTRVIGRSGHSDYGAVLHQFWTEVGATDLTPRSTVLITGDARTNGRPEAAEFLHEISRRARSTYWFDPEPAADWATDGSAYPSYAPLCSQWFEVRTLAQLAQAVERIA